MTQYIPKDVLLAEIEKKIEEIRPYCGACSSIVVAEANNKITVFEYMKDFINTFEVKEVDLENDIQKVIHNHFFDLNGIAIVGTSSYATVDDMVYIAKHFFELGLKTQKGEEV